MGTAADWRPPERVSQLAGYGEFSRRSDISAVALLRRIASHISKAAPLRNILGDVVEFIASGITCDSCVVYVLEGDELILRASKNPHPKALERLKVKLGQVPTTWVAEHRELTMIPQSASTDPRVKVFNGPAEDCFEAFLSVPLVSRGHLVGIINVQNRDSHAYTDHEIGLVSMIGFLVGAEIEMARLKERNADLSDRLESRTLVERAKGILQSDLRISEAEAYQRLQRQSQQMRKSMREIAEAIVLSHAVKSGSQS